MAKHKGKGKSFADAVSNAAREATRSGTYKVTVISVEVKVKSPGEIDQYLVDIDDGA